jgi:hypothetical protein
MPQIAVINASTAISDADVLKNASCIRTAVVQGPGADLGH